METNKEKRVVQIAIGDNVKKLSITGSDNNDQVIMREELSEVDLDQATGGVIRKYYETEFMHHDEPTLQLQFPEPINPWPDYKP